MQTKLQRMPISPGRMSTPMLAASNTPRPSYTDGTSYPKTERLAISLPGANPSGTVFNIPFRPIRASRSM